MKFSLHPEQLQKAQAPWPRAAGMAANQWGYGKRIFLFYPYSDSFDPEVIINPSYEALPDEVTYNIEITLRWEGCFSIPLAAGKCVALHTY